MRKTVSKKLRAIIKPDQSPVNKRVYRRAKKQYSKLPANAKQDYINGLSEFYEQVVAKQYREPVVEGESEG